MGKQFKRSTGSFLHKKLRPEKAKLVREQFPVYYKVAVDEAGGELDFSLELLYDFVAHLGTEDKAFRNLPAEVLVTTNEGFRQIYEHVRKRVGKVDEKVVATRSRVVKEKSTPPKNTIE
ncbi:MAG: hypothetical protein CMI56_00975 [Parcubacteria group bacterium]|nr:hypothetical protein [Parcubacteria group bacterium]